MEILQLIPTITEVENSLKLLSGRSEKREERISELGHRSTETIQSEEQRDQKMKKNGERQEWRESEGKGGKEKESI